MKIEDIPDEMIAKICEAFDGLKQLEKGPLISNKVLNYIREKVKEPEIVCPQCGGLSADLDVDICGVDYWFECEFCFLNSPRERGKEKVLEWMEKYKERMNLEAVRCVLNPSDKTILILDEIGAGVENIFIKRKSK